MGGGKELDIYFSFFDSSLQSFIHSHVQVFELSNKDSVIIKNNYNYMGCINFKLLVFPFVNHSKCTWS